MMASLSWPTMIKSKKYFKSNFFHLFNQWVQECVFYFAPIFCCNRKRKREMFFQCIVWTCPSCSAQHPGVVFAKSTTSGTFVKILTIKLHLSLKNSLFEIYTNASLNSIVVLHWGDLYMYFEEQNYIKICHLNLIKSNFALGVPACACKLMCCCIWRANILTFCS